MCFFLFPEWIHTTDLKFWSDPPDDSCCSWICTFFRNINPLLKPDRSPEAKQNHPLTKQMTLSFLQSTVIYIFLHFFFYNYSKHQHASFYPKRHSKEKTKETKLPIKHIFKIENIIVYSKWFLFTFFFFNTKTSFNFIDKRRERFKCPKKAPRQK